MIFNLLQIALVLSNTFVISAYASGLELNNGSDASCRDALTQSSDKDIIDEYNKIPPSIYRFRYSDEQKVFAVSLIEMFDGDVKRVSALLGIPELFLNLWFSGTNEEINSIQDTEVEKNQRQRGYRCSK